MKRVSVDTQIDRLEALIERLEKVLASHSIPDPKSQEAIDKYIRDWHMNQGRDVDG